MREHDSGNDDHEENDVLRGMLHERNWSVAAHISGLFSSFVLPLLIWWLKKDTSPLIDQHGKEALNFQLTVLPALIICGVLARLLPYAVIGYFSLLIVVVFEVVCILKAAMLANKGERFQYPLSVRILR